MFYETIETHITSFYILRYTDLFDDHYYKYHWLSYLTSLLSYFSHLIYLTSSFMASSNLRRGKKKNINTTGALSNSATSSLRDILNGMAKDNISTSFPIQKNHHKNSSMVNSL